MPWGTDVERRNRALVSFILTTGARDRAVASMKLKHVDLTDGKVYQDAREVSTKYTKSFTTFFFPVGEEFREIVAEWVGYLRRNLLWGNDDPLFPATAVALGKRPAFRGSRSKACALEERSAIRAIFRNTFIAAGLPYFNPHSLRSTLVQLGEIRCRTPEDFKAWSQNVGHEGVMTTFRSYGAVGSRRQGEIIRGLAKEPLPEHQLTDVAGVLRELARSGRLG